MPHAATPATEIPPSAGKVKATLAVTPRAPADFQIALNTAVIKPAAIARLPVKTPAHSGTAKPPCAAPVEVATTPAAPTKPAPGAAASEALMSAATPPKTSGPAIAAAGTAPPNQASTNRRSVPAAMIATAPPADATPAHTPVAKIQHQSTTPGATQTAAAAPQTIAPPAFVQAQPPPPASKTAGVPEIAIASGVADSTDAAAATGNTDSSIEPAARGPTAVTAQSPQKDSEALTGAADQTAPAAAQPATASAAKKPEAAAPSHNVFSALPDDAGVNAPAPHDLAAANPVQAAGTPPALATAQVHSTATSPAAQIGPALSGLHIAPGANGQVTIHLQPAELGAVQVHIERAHDGSTTVTVQVEKAETLHSFQQDLPRLHQALDRAGLPTETRQVTLHLAPATGSDTQSSLGGSGEGQRHGAAPRQAARTVPHEQTEAPEDDAAPAWRAAGINITA